MEGLATADREKEAVVAIEFWRNFRLFINTRLSGSDQHTFKLLLTMESMIGTSFNAAFEP